MIPPNLDLFSRFISSFGLTLFGLMWFFHMVGCLLSIRYYFRWLRTLPKVHTTLLVLANLYIPAYFVIPHDFRTESFILDILFSVVLVVTLAGLFVGGIYHGVLSGLATFKRVLQLHCWHKVLLASVTLDLWVFWLLRG